VNVAQELRQVAYDCGDDRPDIARRLLHLAVRVARMELQLDDIVADAAQAERVERMQTRLPFKLRLVDAAPRGRLP
jgi:hypothetical protein